MKTIKRILLSLIIKLFWLFPIRKRKVVFCSYHGSSYSGNPKYICEAMDKKDKGLDIVWILPDSSFTDGRFRTVKLRSIKGLYEMATACMWIDNSRKPIWMRKRKGQFYLQTWHGGISNKIVEKKAESKLPEEYVKAAKNDSRMADLFLSNSSWLTNNYRINFWYNGPVMEKGLPREDVLHDDNKEYHEKICDYYGASHQTRFVLYAPTFRVNSSLKAYDLNYDALINSLSNNTHDEWKIIIRLHPNIQNEQVGIQYSDKLLNGSNYPEINDLILASEYVISDYSSCMFDAMIAQKKVFIYASDIESYGKERGFEFEWHELPFKVSTDTPSLIYNIRNHDQGDYEKRVKKFEDVCGLIINSHASDDVADYLLDLINKM